MKRLAQVTAMVLITVALVVAMWLLSSAVMLFLLSLVIAAAVRPFAAPLIARGFSRAAAYSLVFLLSFLFFGGLIAVITSSLFSELQHASNRLLDTYTSITVTWPHGQDWQQRLASELPSRQALIDAFTGDQGTDVLVGMVGVGSDIFDLLAQLVVLVSLSIYWTIQQDHFERLWLSLVSAKYRPRARSIWRALETEVGAYVRSELIQSSLAGITLGLAFWVLGLPYPALLALWGALVWLIPWVGVVLALIPAVLVGLIVGWPFAVLAGAVTIAVFAMLETLVEPRLYGRSRVSPVLILITLLIMAQYAGILGTLLAPPLAATLQILGRELWFTSPARAAAQDTASQLGDMRARLAGLKDELSHQPDEPATPSRTLAGQIEKLLDQTEEALGAAGLLPPSPDETALPIFTHAAQPTTPSP